MAASIPPASIRPANLRPATEADLDRLVEIIWSVGSEGRWIGAEVPFDRTERRALLASALTDPSWTIQVAETAEQGVVGHLGLNVARYGVANLQMMLLEGWRGQGIGRQLLDQGLDWAKAAGAHKAALEVWPDNEPAIRLYRRAGFVEEGRKRRHYRRRNGELWDAILMGFPLSP